MNMDTVDLTPEVGTSEPLEKWSREDVQQWFKGGRFSQYASQFENLIGLDLASLTEEQFLRRCPEVGDVIYNELQVIKKRSVGPLFRKETTLQVGVQQQQLPRLGPNEGLWLEQEVKTLREPTCRELFGLLQAKPVVLLRSPPFSGKTSMTTLFYHFVRDVLGQKVIVLSILECYTEQRFEEAVRAAMGVDVNSSAWDMMEPTIFVMDESQIAYQWPSNAFWLAVKAHMSKSHANLRILLLTAHATTHVLGEQKLGLSTPIAFETVANFPILRLRREEFDEYIDSHNNSDFGRHVHLTQGLKECLWSGTGGHVGLVRQALLVLEGYFGASVKMKQAVSEEQIMQYMISNSFIHNMAITRATAHQTLTAEDKEILQEVVLHDTVATAGAAYERIDRINHLLRCGILANMTAVTAGFAAPFIRSTFIQQLFKEAPYSPLGEFSLADFAMQCIARLNPQALKESFGRGRTDDKLLERQWQMEFYRAATTLLPPGRSVSPDVGGLFGADGAVDFYIDSGLKWAIELMREGDRLSEHISRFAPTGRYHKTGASAYLILDFRAKAKGVARSEREEEHVWYVLYSEDYRNVTIVRRGEEDRTLHLMGRQLSRQSIFGPESTVTTTTGKRNIDDQADVGAGQRVVPQETNERNRGRPAQKQAKKARTTSEMEEQAGGTADEAKNSTAEHGTAQLERQRNEEQEEEDG